MMAVVTVRQIKPGSYEEFRRAWEPDRWYPGLQRALVLRHQDDPDQVLTIGLFDFSPDEADAFRDDPEVMRSEDARLRRIAPLEERVVLNAVYEVVDELTE